MRFRPANLGALTGGILAVAVVLLFAPAATAGCGDYVHIAGQAETTEASVPQPVPCACERGQCHAQPPLPPAGEPTATESHPPVDALLLADPATDPSRSTRRLPDSDHIPSPTSSGVFHPPRG